MRFTFSNTFTIGVTKEISAPKNKNLTLMFSLDKPDNIEILCIVTEKLTLAWKLDCKFQTLKLRSKTRAI